MSDSSLADRARARLTVVDLHPIKYGCATTANFFRNFEEFIFREEGRIAMEVLKSGQ